MNNKEIIKTFLDESCSLAEPYLTELKNDLELLELLLAKYVDISVVDCYCGDYITYKEDFIKENTQYAKNLNISIDEYCNKFLLTEDEFDLIYHTLKDRQYIEEKERDLKND